MLGGSREGTDAHGTRNHPREDARYTCRDVGRGQPLKPENKESKKDRERERERERERARVGARVGVGG